MPMVQLGLHSNCCNRCDFCLLKYNKQFSIKQILNEIETAKKNIIFIAESKDNWRNTWSEGISVLGGELFYIQDISYKNAFLDLVDLIIDKILLVSQNQHCKFSTVTNGMYDPNWLLFPVIDKIKNSVGLEHLDINFSYDFKYRFHSDESRKLCENTINTFHNKYNYIAGIQMIITQNVINMYLNGWRTNKFINDVLPGNQICFLYPHPINRGNNFSGAKNLPDFNFTRSSFLKFINLLMKEEPKVFESFLYSTRNSSTFKYTMLYDKLQSNYKQQPILSDGKEIINKKCNHSILYQCYSNTNHCMLCDLEGLI